MGPARCSQPLSPWGVTAAHLALHGQTPGTGTFSGGWCHHGIQGVTGNPVHVRVIPAEGYPKGAGLQNLAQVLEKGVFFPLCTVSPPTWSCTGGAGAVGPSRHAPVPQALEMFPLQGLLFPFGLGGRKVAWRTQGVLTVWSILVMP